MTSTKEKHISYSVVIRTLGNSGEKYQRLLKSIKDQTIQPEEIIVVLPEGYSLDYIIGIEKVIHSKKGMVIQRAEGIRQAKSEYILVVDDDIEFKSDFISKLYDYLVKNLLDCVLPMEGIPSDNDESINLRYPLLIRIRGMITGQLFQVNRRSKFLDVITVTAGHKVYLKSSNLDECYYCQTGSFQCFFIKTAMAQSANFEKEVWLQEGVITQYAALDDPTFFYKLYLAGMKMAYALRVRYSHLDAAVGHMSESLLQSKINRYYSGSRNRTIFWYKFLWQESHSCTRRLHVAIGGIYGFVNTTFYNIIININPKYWKAIKAMFQGYADAIKVIRSI